MDPLLKKLNYKGLSEILILNAPPELKPFIDSASLETTCIQEVDLIKKIDFAIYFVMNQATVDKIMDLTFQKLADDAIIWFSYPKKTSKKYQCDIDRDHGWQTLGNYGFEPVRQVAINEDFSALRFRKVTYIKSITRNVDMALTEEAKKRTSAQLR